MLIMHKTNIYL